MSSMSGSYLAGVDGEPGADHGGDVEAEEEDRDAFMESRGPSQQDGVSCPATGTLACAHPLLHPRLFLSGVFPGAEGKQLLAGCGGAGFRGDERAHDQIAAFICTFRATFVLSVGERRH